jgi:hypothetical protein
MWNMGHISALKVATFRTRKPPVVVCALATLVYSTFVYSCTQSLAVVFHNILSVMQDTTLKIISYLEDTRYYLIFHKLSELVSSR